MARYTPMESLVVRQLACALSNAGVPLNSLGAFGSRAWVRSTARSNLGVTAELDSCPDPRLSPLATGGGVDAGRRFSARDEGGSVRLWVKAVS